MLTLAKGLVFPQLAKYNTANSQLSYWKREWNEAPDMFLINHPKSDSTNNYCIATWSLENTVLASLPP